MSLRPSLPKGAFWLCPGAALKPSREIAKLRTTSLGIRCIPLKSVIGDPDRLLKILTHSNSSYINPLVHWIVHIVIVPFGYAELAREIALKHVHAVASVCSRTGTIWENYAPDSIAPGRHVDRKPVVADMVGWSGIGPILYFMEFVVGLTPDAPSNTLLWDMRSTRRSGCERFRFNGHTLSLVSTPDREGAGMRVNITSDGPFTLVVLRSAVRRTVPISRGTTNLSLPPE
jgi:hypothetical protein